MTMTMTLMMPRAKTVMTGEKAHDGSPKNLVCIWHSARHHITLKAARYFTLLTSSSRL
jgi:hypothetical protein